jgi:hypothetical protein
MSLQFPKFLSIGVCTVFFGCGVVRTIGSRAPENYPATFKLFGHTGSSGELLVWSERGCTRNMGGRFPIQTRGLGNAILAPFS